MTFDDAFDLLLGSEGDYSNNSQDPGGETRWGITRRVALKNGYTGDMHTLPAAFAKVIYKRDYWDKVRASELPDVLRYAVFDGAVNSGTQMAIIWLQSALHIVPDSIFGEDTLKMVWAADPKSIGIEMVATRLEFMTRTPQWGQFSRGWSIRIAKVMRTLK